MNLYVKKKLSLNFKFKLLQAKKGVHGYLNTRFKFVNKFSFLSNFAKNQQKNTSGEQFYLQISMWAFNLPYGIFVYECPRAPGIETSENSPHTLKQRFRINFMRITDPKNEKLAYL